MTNLTPSGPVPAKRGTCWQNLNWNVVVGISAIHLGATLAVFPQFFSWSGLAVAGLLFWLSGLIGTTLGFHRLLSHRSFKTPKWFEYFLTCCGCLGWQGGPIQWVGMHRLHHAHSDDELDPHSPQHGFTWSHVLWCMHNDGNQNPEDAAKDLSRDLGQRLINRWFFVPQLLLVPSLYLLGQWGFAAGWSWVVWGVCVRTVAQYHVTWFVNSAAHTWGYRNYDTDDNSTNLWWLGILSGGEGWHNNHHAHQRSAAHGLRWFEIDLTYWTIRGLGLIGLAREIILPRQDQRPVSKKRRAALSTVVKATLPKPATE
jgi:stearoyl-CoA desaturase (delta-9 desaturase)